jgi:selenocysteine lyase/cysteine desulfurase
VRAAYDSYLTDWDEQGAPWEYWVEMSERARNAFAGLINAAADEVAVTTSLSAAVSSLATGMRFAGKRSKVVLTDWEFPTIGQIWNAQKSRGARVEYVKEDANGALPLAHFERAIDDETAIVSITHVSYRNGNMVDVEAVTRLAHERGAMVLLDAYQSVGSLPVDVKALDVDFLAAGALKYLLGSAGLGWLYVRRELVERFWPASTGWFADDDIFKMDAWDYSPAKSASRFQSGTPPIPAIYAGVAGIDLLQEIGVAETREHVQALNHRLIDGLDDLRVQVATSRKRTKRGALICIRSRNAPELVAALRREGIVTSSRDGNLRISAHCYNGVDDVDAVLAALARNRRLLVPS